MKASMNSMRRLMRRYGCGGEIAPRGAAPLARRIGAQLGAIEEVIDIGSRYRGVLIAQVVSCQPHPDADRLRVCLIDDGGKAEGVTRDDNGYVQVVCGASNVRGGLMVAWLPPGTTVPESAGKDPFVLEARKLRGVVSQGMLASPRELALGDSHEGILEIGEEVAPGTDFAEHYGLAGDVIFDIENKMFTHRPDCFGFLGVAREIAGIQQQPFKSPDWYRVDAPLPAIGDGPAGELPLLVRNELPELVPRFTAIAMRDVQVAPSPVWLQVELAKAGLRPINNIVDLTNYFMLETSQPLHAYDYDKLRALDAADEADEGSPGAESGTAGATATAGSRPAAIVVRHPRPGEKIVLLNGKEIEPRPEAIMIASASRLIGVGGVMGGGETEVDETTRNIIIECANFDMYSIRRTSMAHGLFTDAVTRFNKGQSPLQTRAVLAKMTAAVQDLAGGQAAGPLVDDTHLPAGMMERASIHPPVTLTAEFINTRLGLDLAADEMAALLRNVEFQVRVAGRQLTVQAPFWRTDIEIPEDVVEEIGRLYGFDRLPLELPRRAIAPAVPNRLLDLKARLRQALSQAGATEVLSYSFVHGDLLGKVGQDAGQAYQLSNALSPDLQYYRLSLAPSLLDRVHANVKAGYDEFALFEIGKTHLLGQTEQGNTSAAAGAIDASDAAGEAAVPAEAERLALVFAADDKAAKHYGGAPFYQARRYLAALLADFGLGDEFALEPLEPAALTEDQPSGAGSRPPAGGQALSEERTMPAARGAGTGQDIPAVSDAWLRAESAPYEPGRSAVIRLGAVRLGIIGEYRSAVQRALKLPAYCAGFELDVAALLPYASGRPAYQPLSRFPKIEQDISLKVPAGLSYRRLYDQVLASLGQAAPAQTSLRLSPVDIYQRPDDPAHRQITLRLAIVSYEKTLRDAEVAALLDQAAAAAGEAFGAERL